MLSRGVLTKTVEASAATEVAVVVVGAVAGTAGAATAAAGAEMATAGAETPTSGVSDPTTGVATPRMPVGDVLGAVATTASGATATALEENVIGVVLTTAAVAQVLTSAAVAQQQWWSVWCLRGSSIRQDKGGVHPCIARHGDSAGARRPARHTGWSTVGGPRLTWPVRGPLCRGHAAHLSGSRPRAEKCWESGRDWHGCCTFAYFAAGPGSQPLASATRAPHVTNGPVITRGPPLVRDGLVRDGQGTTSSSSAAGSSALQHRCRTDREYLGQTAA